MKNKKDASPKRSTTVATGERMTVSQYSAIAGRSQLGHTAYGAEDNIHNSLNVFDNDSLMQSGMHELRCNDNNDDNRSKARSSHRGGSLEQFTRSSARCKTSFQYYLP